MKISSTALLIIIATLLLICSAINGAASDPRTEAFPKEFDFYVHPNSPLRLYDCKIKAAPCRYHEAVPHGKPPLGFNAIFIGTGVIDLQTIIAIDRDLDQARITILKIIDLELKRGLPQGVSAIKDLLDPQGDICFKNSYSNIIVEKLAMKIEEESTEHDRIKNVISGQKLLTKLRCSN